MFYIYMYSIMWWGNFKTYIWSAFGQSICITFYICFSHDHIKTTIVGTMCIVQAPEFLLKRASGSRKRKLKDSKDL